MASDTQQRDDLEARVLSGMYRHRHLSVSSRAFRHDGRRFLVAEWEQHGMDDPGATERLLKIVEKRLLDDAWSDIESMAHLMDTWAMFDEISERLHRLARVEAANADAGRAIEEFQRTGGGVAAAASVATAMQRVVEADAPEIAAPSGVELFDRLMAEAASTQGREFLGIKFPTLPGLNRRLDGLRGLTFLAGSPGTGKTSLALQMAFDAAESNPDTVVVFLTCEMSALEAQASVITRLTTIPFHDLMKGKKETPRDQATAMMLPRSDIDRLNAARDRIAALGDRWRVVQPSDFGGAFIGSKRGGAGVFAPVTAMVRRAKQATGATRMLVVVDSLQRVPVAEPVSGSVTGWVGEAIERDNYVVAAMNDLASGPGDAVVCISEQNKTQQGTATITSMKGTATIGYACDAALLLTDPEDYGGKDTQVMERDFHTGIRRVEAHLVKGRAGMSRGTESLVFQFMQHRFDEGSPR